MPKWDSNERAKTVRALDRAATAIGSDEDCFSCHGAAICCVGPVRCGQGTELGLESTAAVQSDGH
jgi:hypothetical protein